MKTFNTQRSTLNPQSKSPFYMSGYYQRDHEQQVRRLVGRWTFIALGIAAVVAVVLKLCK